MRDILGLSVFGLLAGVTALILRLYDILDSFIIDTKGPCGFRSRYTLFYKILFAHDCSNMAIDV